MFLREEEEFDNIRNFLLHRYHLDIRSPEEPLKPLIESLLRFFMSLQVWKDRCFDEALLGEESRSLLKELISCTLHLISLAGLQMRLPFLMMTERCFRLLSRFFETTDPSGTRSFFRSRSCPLVSLPAESPQCRKILERERYDRLLPLCDELFIRYEALYEEIDSRLSFEKAGYFSNEQWLDFTSPSRLDLEFFKDSILFLSSVFNTLMILSDFDFYLEKIPEKEKSALRRAIDNRYALKSRLSDLFSEI